MIQVKNDLIEWIENVFEPEILQKIVELKNTIESRSLISDINTQKVLENNFDEQFAAGMTSDELLENVAAHIEAIAEREISVVEDVQSEYAVKDDFEERFEKGLNPDKAREESKSKVREWWAK